MPALRFRTLWTGIGLMLIAAVVVLSLVNIGQTVPITGGDKLGHVIAYGVLMYWWGMVQPAQRWYWLACLPLLGLTMEGIQGLVPHRYMEWGDALANVAGVLAGRLVLVSGARRWLASADQFLADRLDARLP